MNLALPLPPLIVDPAFPPPGRHDVVVAALIVLQGLPPLLVLVRRELRAAC
jgi:hypothetical protein